MTTYRDPFSRRAEEIAWQAIARADRLGRSITVPAPALLEEKRDMYQEAIEELLDEVYYLTREVARLEELRGIVVGMGMGHWGAPRGQHLQNENDRIIFVPCIMVAQDFPIK